VDENKRPQGDVREMMRREFATSIRRGIALSACAVLAACGDGPSSGLGPWQEEVQLSNGRVIVVERFEDSEVRGPIGDAKDSYINATNIKFIAPPDLAALPVLTMPYRPILLDYDPELGTWFAIGVNERTCWPGEREKGHLDGTGRINIHPNFEYRLLDGQWREAEIGPERIGLRGNLLIERTIIENWNARHRPLPLDDKRRVDSDNGIPTEYRRVQPSVSCG
jgi:hypothetical protein